MDRVIIHCCSLAKISMVAELTHLMNKHHCGCSLAKISMVAEQRQDKP